MVDFLFLHLRSELFNKILFTNHNVSKFTYLTKDNEENVIITYDYLNSLDIKTIKLDFKYKHGDGKYYNRIWIHTNNSSHLLRDGFTLMIDFPDTIKLWDNEVDMLRKHKVLV